MFLATLLVLKRVYADANHDLPDALAVFTFDAFLRVSADDDVDSRTSIDIASSGSFICVFSAFFRLVI